jgi:hypothetical protein
MIEVAMVFNDQGEVIYWHLPPGRSGGSIPDTRSLWEVLWENRDRLGGVAHTHPWNGSPWPSQKDVTTFRAIEKGLGEPLLWPIVTFDQIGYWHWSEPDKDYILINGNSLALEVQGIERLRELSRGEDNGG